MHDEWDTGSENCILQKCLKAQRSFQRHIFYLLCKNIIKTSVSWLLSSAASLQSCDRVDLKHHYHYSWLPVGGTE